MGTAIRKHLRDFVDFIDAQRFEIIPKRGLHRALPASLDRELRRQSRLLAQSGAVQPLGGARITALERRRSIELVCGER